MTRVLLPSVQPGGEVYQPPLQRAPFLEEILHRYPKRHRRKLLCRVTMMLYSALQPMRLACSFVALAALLRTVNEHLHERFLLAILIIVQQAHRGSLRLCRQLVASSLDQVVAQHACGHSSMAAARQPTVHVKCFTIRGRRPKLLSVRSVSEATQITRHTASGTSHLSPRSMSNYEIALSFASTALLPMTLRGSFNCPPRGSLSTRSPPWLVTMSSTTWSS